VIVGAGPAGIVTAIELARRAVSVRISEMKAEPERASRAKGLQPRTLEIFEDIGIVERILDGGSLFPRWRSYRGRTLQWEKSVYELLGMRISPPSADRRYSETLMIPQWRTERILRERLRELGVEVDFGSRLTDFLHDADGMSATISTLRGTERIRCRYLVGADGARSAVRKSLGIPFTGQTSEGERYVVADVRADALDNTHWLNWSLPDNPKHRVSMCPLPHSEYFQFVAPISADEQGRELSLSALQALFDERCGWPGVALTDLSWIVSHTPNARLAERFRKGPVFLVGDAAHSPPTSPGQGLNISIQDAYNLGWKLAAVLSGADVSLLDTYEAERRPVAAGVLGVLAAELVAQGIDPAAAKVAQAQVQSDIFNLNHNYRGSPLALERRRRPGAVQAGDRAPDALVCTTGGETGRLFEWFKGPHFTALWFNAHRLPAGFPPIAEDSDTLRSCLMLPNDDGTRLGDVRTIYDVAGVEPVLLLIRPDGYVGLCADTDLSREWRDEVGMFLPTVAHVLT
jgi:2-polyprenyl-6-methoxyphenol hydroxylase-like FAD-dependent oxidoreductase